jgi:hypothetical protein
MLLINEDHHFATHRILLEETATAQKGTNRTFYKQVIINIYTTIYNLSVK